MQGNCEKVVAVVGFGPWAAAFLLHPCLPVARSILQLTGLCFGSPALTSCHRLRMEVGKSPSKFRAVAGVLVALVLWLWGWDSGCGRCVAIRMKNNKKNAHYTCVMYSRKRTLRKMD